ncbi:hemin-degrading factor [Saccharopolyspora sp. K220]|uniref:hemin-degrading factor n=1 Tax=Saccharopolyspora soli TaxID=2926618 RepID=UPI001F580931|nr:hemin-degrading factor [Saccharopolyspora soli]MCI2423756.1 hemin-degrading factor [Saccharopolyspora soli]
MTRLLTGHAATADLEVATSRTRVLGAVAEFGPAMSLTRDGSAVHGEVIDER